MLHGRVTSEAPWAEKLLYARGQRRHFVAQRPSTPGDGADHLDVAYRCAPLGA